MFEYTLIHWTAFLSAAVLLNLSPGPDIAYILGQALRHGRRQGFVAMLGAWTGASLHVAMAAAGLSAILAASALAFSIVKWLGALYLIWLGVGLLRLRGGAFIASPDAGAAGGYSIYWQGVLVSALNPKVAVFFLAFLPQFVVAGAGPVGAQLFLHGSLVIAVAACIEPPLVMVGSRLGVFLKTNRRIALWLDRGLGALFVSLGMRLALSSR
jgi:threonine/homoserine/homoserine lactone efflux protein